MEKVRPWCGQPSDRGRLKIRSDQVPAYLSSPRKGPLNARVCGMHNMKMSLLMACLRVTTVNPAKTVERIEMQFGTWTREVQEQFMRWWPGCPWSWHFRWEHTWTYQEMPAVDKLKVAHNIM